jgi:hypothetical protein
MRRSHLDKYHVDSNIVGDIISFVMKLVLDTTIVVAAIRSGRVTASGLAVLSPGEALARLEGNKMRKSNFALRLQPSLLDEARKLAEAEGVALNQLINVALAEKLSALRTEAYLTERAARASIPKALAILKRSGAGRPPMKGDQLQRDKTKRAR